MSDSEELIFGEQEFERRRATWLELFYDLAYVAAVAQLTYLLIEVEGSLVEYAQFFFLFLTVFISWLGAVVYRNFRGEEENKFERLITILQMFFALVMSVSLQEAFGVGAVGFVVGYVGTRYLFTLLLAYSYQQDPDTAPKDRYILWGNRSALAIWVASLLVPPPFQQMMWVIALITEFLVPYISGTWKKPERFTRRLVNKFHLPERLGLFTILVMGESLIVVAVVNNIADGLISLPNALIATFGFLIIAILWWLYFNHVERFAMGKRFNLYSYVYTHIFILTGVMLVAAGIKIGMLGTEKYADPDILITVGIILSLAGFNGLKWATGQKGLRALVMPTVFFSIAAVGTLFITVLTFTTHLAALAALFLIYAVFELKQCRMSVSAPELQNQESLVQ